MISAMLVHEASVRKVTARCVELGKTVLAGGPLFTTGHAKFPEIEHFLLGEAEELMPQLVADLQAGQLLFAVAADNYGWLGFSPHPATIWRGLGCVLMMGGVLLIAKY